MTSCKFLITVLAVVYYHKSVFCTPFIPSNNIENQLTSGNIEEDNPVIENVLNGDHLQPNDQPSNDLARKKRDTDTSKMSTALQVSAAESESDVDKRVKRQGGYYGYGCEEECTSEYDPVCGKDGYTYDNYCMAVCAGVGIAYPGRCQSFQYRYNRRGVSINPNIPNTGFKCYCEGVTAGNNCRAVCHSVPDGLYPDQYRVCAEDKMWYPNECHAKCEGLKYGFYWDDYYCRATRP